MTNTVGLDDIAEACHEANRVLQRALGEPVNPPWAEAGIDLRDSARDGVDNALAGATPEDSHRNWLEFKEDDGWGYGPIKDTEAKTHPCMVPYDRLPKHQQAKDHMFVSIVCSLAPIFEFEQ